MNPTDPASLRAAFENADSFFARAMAFWQLMASPDLRWADLIEGLKFPEFTRGQAALDLHIRLKVPQRAGQIVKDPDFWEDYLRAAGIDRMAKVKE